jgi:enoyl-CoA hydratase/carnithine racemase
MLNIIDEFTRDCLAIRIARKLKSSYVMKARDMLFLGQRYSAAELKACGVAWRVAPDSDLRAEAGKVGDQSGG